MLENVNNKLETLYALSMVLYEIREELERRRERYEKAQYEKLNIVRGLRFYIGKQGCDYVYRLKYDKNFEYNEEDGWDTFKHVKLRYGRHGDVGIAGLTKRQFIKLANLM